MKTIGISQIQRELHLLNDFDIIEIIDKKKNAIKGYFVDAKYAKTIKELEQKNNQNTISSYSGLWKDIDIDLNDIRQKAWKK